MYDVRSPGAVFRVPSPVLCLPSSVFRLPSSDGVKSYHLLSILEMTGNVNTRIEEYGDISRAWLQYRRNHPPARIRHPAPGSSRVQRGGRNP